MNKLGIDGFCFYIFLLYYNGIIYKFIVRKYRVEKIWDLEYVGFLFINFIEYNVSWL